ARESFLALLNDEIDDVQLGAWWLAMRIKGETADELAAFEAAMQETLSFRVRCDFPCVVLPCYNGARQLPNLTPLLAWTLAKRGVRVLLHGVRNDPTRVTTFELFNALQFPVARDANEAERALRERGFVFTALDAVHPRLAQLISHRWRIGVRSTAHTVAKLLQPVDALSVTRVVALTHGDYIDRMGVHLQTTMSKAIVFRGCEGEPVLHPKRKVDVQIFQDGMSRIANWHGVETHDLPDTFDIATTSAFIRDVMNGARPMPPWIEWLAQEMQSSAHENNATNNAQGTPHE
ncbi:MAG: DNA-binding protein YbiB, partial [Casimicrobium sp.]